MSPEACKDCHPDHYRQWSGSSHAYAADDPVFIAMNARFQRDPGQDPRDLCVRCHAPVAWSEGATVDGANLDELPSHLKGVTCYACHAVTAVNAQDHGLTFDDRSIFFAGLPDSVHTDAHASAYSPLLDREEWQSATLCGTCHDFRHRGGTHAHRTFTEWTDSMFEETFSRLFLSCGGCHMPGTNAPIASGDVPTRRLHDHSLPGVNVALLDWPEKDAQRAAIQADLDPSLFTRVCLTADRRPQVTLDNVMAGHSWPSGDGYTRRAWVEITAEKDGQVIFQSGVVPEGTSVDAALAADPGMWVISDTLTDEDDNPVLFSWEASSLLSNLLPFAITADPSQPGYYHSVTREYPVLPAIPDTMSLRVHIRPIGLEIIDALVASDGLSPAIRDQIPTFSLAGSEVLWQGAPGTCVPAL